jgi:hypothetical protein
MSLVWIIVVVVCDIVAVLSLMLWFYYQDVHELCHTPSILDLEVVLDKV